MTTHFSQTAAYIWSLADLLRGDFRQSQYGRVILPFTILRRLECVLESSKPKVLDQAGKLKAMTSLQEDAREKFLLRAAGESFYNTSPMDLSKLGSADIKSNLLTYVDNFSKDAREIFEHFKFGEFVAQLDEANLLYKVVQKVANTDLSPKAISNHDMGLVFEELIRRFAESSNDTAGEHFTPRDIVRLTTSLVFMEDKDALTETGIIRTIYDPTAGTGGFLSSGMEYVYELNPKAVMRAFGQELNPESYGKLAEVEAEVRALVKADFKDLKEKQVKDLLAPKTWNVQKALLVKGLQLQAVIGTGQCDDFNEFEGTLKKALKKTGIKLETKERKQLLDAVTWTNPDAEPVIKKVLKTPAENQPDPMYGAFEYRRQVVQFQPDSNLRDNEDVPLTAETARGANVNPVNEAYFNKEVSPHVKDAWIDPGKCDDRDGQIGIVGYEIPFNRHFYQYEPPRDLAEIDADLDVLSAEIMEMLREVRS